MKKLMQWIAATMIIGSVLELPARAAESASVLLQKGIFTEETEGNLDAAIKIYEQIATEAAANRAVVVQAQYRLAVCYQKKGDEAQAITILKGILVQFPTDVALSQKAQALLAGLGQPASEAVTVRKIPLPPGWVISVSSSGRFLAYMPKGSKDLVVYEIATGKSWAAIKGKGDKYIENAEFSPEDRLIAYVFGGSIHTARIDGSEAKPIYKGDGKSELWVVDWSPDGGSLIVDSTDSTSKSLFTLDVKTGTMKELKRKGHPEELWRPHFSSDGRYLAYQMAADGGKRKKIFLRDLQSFIETPLVEREVDQIVGWWPGDTKVLFSSERTGTKGLWAIAVRDGKPSGEPEMVKANLGDGFGVKQITRDGLIYYTEEKASTESVYVAAANLETGEITDQPRRVTERFPGTQYNPVWSNDGQKLMIAVQRGQRRFLTVPLSSGDETDYPVAHIFDNVLQQHAWSENGGFLLVQSFYKALQKSGIYRYDLASGKTQPLVVTESGKNWNAHPRLARDGNSFYYARREFFQSADKRDDWKDQIIRHDLRSGKEDTVYAPAEKLQIWWPFELSPDGTRLAVVISDQFVKEDYVVAIKVVGLNGGESKEVVRMAPRENVTSLTWAPDGKRLVSTRELDDNNRNPQGLAGVWITAVDSGETVQLKLSLPHMRHIAIHPDGRQIAFQTRSRFGWDRDLWVMEGLLPKPVAQAAPSTKQN